MDHLNHDHAAHGAHDANVMQLLCDGTHAEGAHGSWKGHVYPGVVFILWGSWWAWNTAALYLWRSPRRPYSGRPWYPMPLRALRFLEPALKLLVPLVAMNMELWADHHGEWQSLYCAPGTKFAGRFDMSNLNNWQHALSYPAFMLSGIVDIAGAVVPLPPGTSQAVLGSAFAASTFIMYTHEKHEPQDKAVHWLLAVAMLLSTAGVFGEMLARRSPLVGAGKSLALVLQGAWLVKVAAIEFEGRTQWSPEYPGGAMFASTVFAFIAVLCIASLFAFYVLLALARQRGWLRLEALLPPAEDEEDEEEDEEQAYHGLHHRKTLHHDDSANHSDDNDAEVVPLAAVPSKKGGAGVVPFQIQHSRSDTADAAWRV
ncbi:hypothetical protein ABPG75_005412 [Micractinium tetrahymenae]